jgi:hypothetical protein
MHKMVSDRNVGPAQPRTVADAAEVLLGQFNIDQTDERFKANNLTALSWIREREVRS